MRSVYSSLIKFIVFLVIIIVLSLGAVYFLIIKADHNGHDLEISFLIYVATAAIAIIAYIEFDRANQLNTNELLTFISNRWSSKEIIKARQIVHEIFINKYRFDNECNPAHDFDKAMVDSSLAVYEMSKKHGDEGKNFIYLLNLLDHFESVSYFHVSKQIDFDNIKNIYGNNMIFYYRILEKYIKQRQSHITQDFCNYTKMYDIFNTKNNK